jgi:hypothetical protein
MIFQDPYTSQNSRFTVFKWVQEPLIIHSLGDAEWCRSRVMKTLEEAGLKPTSQYVDAYPHELSGGQRQRLAIARALGLAAIVLARPNPAPLTAGLIIAALGEALRIWAAGHLIKGGELTRSGPYSWTRNPLYLGSALMGLGFCIAAGRWELGVLLGVLLLGVYRPVILTEAQKLVERFPEAYKEYAETVPLFIPRPWRRGSWGRDRRFSWERVWANKEYKTAAGWLSVAVILWIKMKWS